MDHSDSDSVSVSDPLIPCRADFHFLQHQEDGIRWMIQRDSDPVIPGGILADDMGLGKTCQSIGLIRNGRPLETLIVCPPALIDGWKSELELCGFYVATMIASVPAWDFPPLTIRKLDGEVGGAGEVGAGAGGKVVSDLAAVNRVVWLTTYPKTALYAPFLTRCAFGRIILDEGHAIRNGKSTARFSTLMKIAEPCLARWILSATPIQNGRSDWNNLCIWLRVPADLSVSQSGFAQSIMLRRTMDQLRDDIKALPPSPIFIDHNLSIPPDSPEFKLLHGICAQLQRAISNKVSVLIKLVLWLRIQQFLIHPQIYIQAMRSTYSSYSRPDWILSETVTATKWTEFLLQLSSCIRDSQPTIVFCNFKHEILMVQQSALDLGASVFVIEGGLPSGAVGHIVQQAKHLALLGKSPVVVIVQIVAGGCGLNLQFCNRILFLSRHWNPAIVHQAVGRAVRIGQSHVVHVHFFRIVDDLVDNIDLHMSSLHSHKIAAAQHLCPSLFQGFHLFHDKEVSSEVSTEVSTDEQDEGSDEDSDSDSQEEGDPQ